VEVGVGAMATAEGTRRRAEHLSWLGYAVIGLMATAYGAAMPELVRHLHQTYGQLSVLFALQSGGNTVAYFYANHLVDRWGTERVLLAGFALFSAATGLLALVATFALWAALAFIVGVAFALVDVGGSRLISDLHRPHQAQAFNHLNLWFGVGAVSAPIAVGILNASGLPVALVFALAAALSLVGAVGMTTLGELPGEAAEPGGGLLANLRLFAAAPWLRALTFLAFLYVAAESGFSAWVAAYVHVQAGLPDAIASLYPAAYQVGLTVTRILIGPVLPKLRLERLLLLGGLGAAVASGLAAAYGQNPWLVVAAAALTGACLSPAFPVILTVAGREAPRREGQAFFFIFTSLAIAALVVPWAEGQVFGQTPALAMAMTPLLTLGMGVLAMILERATRSGPPSPGLGTAAAP